jgi:hypothetical protein
MFAELFERVGGPVAGPVGSCSYQAFLVHVHTVVKLLRDGTGWEIEYPRDSWRLHTLPRTRHCWSSMVEDAADARVDRDADLPVHHRRRCGDALLVEAGLHGVLELQPGLRRQPAEVDACLARGQAPLDELVDIGESLLPPTVLVSSDSPPRRRSSLGACCRFPASSPAPTWSPWFHPGWRPVCVRRRALARCPPRSNLSN